MTLTYHEREAVAVLQQVRKDLNDMLAVSRAMSAAAAQLAKELP